MLGDRELDSPSFPARTSNGGMDCDGTARHLLGILAEQHHELPLGAILRRAVGRDVPGHLEGWIRGLRAHARGPHQPQDPRDAGEHDCSKRAARSTRHEMMPSRHASRVRQNRDARTGYP
jgi:hypothetical protein